MDWFCPLLLMRLLSCRVFVCSVLPPPLSFWLGDFCSVFRLSFFFSWFLILVVVVVVIAG